MRICCNFAHVERALARRINKSFVKRFDGAIVRELRDDGSKIVQGRTLIDCEDRNRQGQKPARLKPNIVLTDYGREVTAADRQVISDQGDEMMIHRG